jgi:predicted  nucleic acid-binding Zn-ribbon protein
MQDNNPSQFGSQATSTSSKPNQADKEWSDLQRDLDTLGRQLAELTTHTAQLGETFLASLQARFQDVKDHAATYRQATEQQFEQVRQTAASQADSTFSEMRARSSEAAKQVWERSEPLRQGARDVGEGVVRAWSEIRASLGKAAGRLNTEQSTPNGSAPVQSDDRRETH